MLVSDTETDQSQDSTKKANEAYPELQVIKRSQKEDDQSKARLQAKQSPGPLPMVNPSPKGRREGERSFEAGKRRKRSGRGDDGAPGVR